MTVYGPYLTRFIWAILQPYVTVSYTVENDHIQWANAVSNRLPRSRITGSVCGRKRPSTIPLQSYTTVFCRITCARITIVYLRDCIRRETIVDGEIRRKTDIAYGFRIQESYTVVFLSVYGCISSYTTRRYTIVIRAQVIRQNTAIHGRLRSCLFDLGTLTYDTAKYGRNTIDMERVKYDRKRSFTAVHD